MLGRALLATKQESEAVAHFDATNVLADDQVFLREPPRIIGLFVQGLAAFGCFVHKEEEEERKKEEQEKRNK